MTAEGRPDAPPWAVLVAYLVLIVFVALYVVLTPLRIAYRYVR